MISISNAISISGIPASLLSGGAPSSPDFVFTVDTTQAGSAADTIVLPLLSGGTYSGTIDWGTDGRCRLSAEAGLSRRASRRAVSARAWTRRDIVTSFG